MLVFYACSEFIHKVRQRSNSVVSNNDLPGLPACGCAVESAVVGVSPEFIKGEGGASLRKEEVFV